MGVSSDWGRSPPFFMYTFGASSLKKLNTCHPVLEEVARLALMVSPYDFTILHGFRDEDHQNRLVAEGASRTPWPTSKHNHCDALGNPKSLAIDIAPWINGGIPWEETHIFAAVAGVFLAVANEYEVDLRWGGDWDGDGLTNDQTLLDYGHLELVGAE